MSEYQKVVEKAKNCQCHQHIYIMPIGPTPKFSIGSVTTGDPGTQASVTITPNFNKYTF